jgi:hypothetical protein
MLGVDPQRCDRVPRGNAGCACGATARESYFLHTTQGIPNRQTDRSALCYARHGMVYLYASNALKLFT